MINIIENVKVDSDINEIEKYCNYLNDKVLDFEWTIVFMGDEEIKKINFEFRDKDVATDVLTFIENIDGYMGDVLISIDHVKEQAKKFSHEEKRELFFLITHGYLHLCGYDHQTQEEEEEMFKIQKELLSDYEIRR